MNATSLKQQFRVAAVFTAMLVGSQLAQAQVFFGETLGAGEALRVAPNAATLAAQSNFLASLTTPGIEDFETSVGNSVVFGNGVTATLVGGGRATQAVGTNGFGRYPTSGDKFWESGVNMTLSFSQAVSAFGFYGVDIGDFNGQLSLGFYNGLTLMDTIIVPHTVSGAGGGVLYFGVITAFDFDSIAFGNTSAADPLQNFDFFAFDDFTQGLRSQVVGAVPEPSTYGLMGAGALLGAIMIRRRLSAKKAA